MEIVESPSIRTGYFFFGAMLGLLIGGMLTMWKHNLDLTFVVAVCSYYLGQIAFSRAEKHRKQKQKGSMPEHRPSSPPPRYWN